MPVPGAKQWLELIDESAFGVTQTTSPLAIWIRLHEDDAFTMVPVPGRYEVRSADARNRPVINVSSRYTLAGSLKLLAYSDFGSADTVPLVGRMLDWATTIGASGFTDDLKSYTVRHYDGVRNREYNGVKVKSLKYMSAAETNEGVASLALELVAQKYNPTDPVSFAEPAVGVFSQYPYKHIETSGGLILRSSGGATRTKYGSLELTVANELKPLFYESAFASDIPYNGRTVDLVCGKVQFNSSTDRANFENQSAITASAVYTKVTPAHTLTLDLKTAARVSGLDRSLPLGDAPHETIHLRSFYDTTATTDFSYAVT